jgi:hypothetical protein
MFESTIKNCAGGLVLALCALQPAWSADTPSSTTPAPAAKARAKTAAVQVAKAPPAAPIAAKDKTSEPTAEKEAEKAQDKPVQPSTPGAAEAQAKIGPDTAAATGLDSRIQDVKSDVIRLNRDLMVLEEELLFPANTQVALFVSMDVGKLFSLDSVQVTLDDKVVSNYLYTPLEVQALHRGGVQRMYVGNLKAGEHTLTAFFTGKGPHDRDYKRGATLKFAKETGAKYIELQIRDSGGKLQPEFDVKVWQ